MLCFRLSCLACVQCADVVFISPPWGGPGYSSSQVFNLQTMVPLDGFRVFQVAQQVTDCIAYYVPRNVDVQQVSRPSSLPPLRLVCGQCACLSVQLAALAGPGGSVEVEQHFINSKLKTMTAYFGELIEF